MKKIYSILVSLAFISACGSSTKPTESTKTDAEIADEIIKNIDDAKNDLINTTEETLTEVDSLLENL